MIGDSGVITDRRIGDVRLIDRDDGRSAYSEDEKCVGEVS